jgi:hypothetical protein
MEYEWRFGGIIHDRGNRSKSKSKVHPLTGNESPEVESRSSQRKKNLSHCHKSVKSSGIRDEPESD